MIIGYTCGVFDMFHVGHVELLKNASSLCDKLIVGLTIDEKVKYKGTKSVFSYDDRKRILDSCIYVDVVIPQDDHNKITAYHKIKYDILFVGDDWYQSEKWKEYELTLSQYNVKVIYFPYTNRISTTLLKTKLNYDT